MLKRFLKFHDAMGEFSFSSYRAFLNARDGFILILLARLYFRPETIDLFIRLLQEKRIINSFKHHPYSND
ncbi:MAG: hypothetical protein JAZ02_09350 [Candidatus Thiodiazotropha endolucinida]|nr:hypothetical protein [Candidatus Thiodiazotropha endolucinida]